MYKGDIRLGDTIDFKFTTRQVSGTPFTLAGTPVLSAYVDNGTTELTAGITLTVDFDSRTGLNHVRVVATSGNGYTAGTNVDIVITTGTVNTVSVVGEVVGSFSIEKRSAVMPTTAGRTLDITATGAAGIDWGNVENPTTALNLSGTNIDTDQVVASVTGAVGSVTGSIGSVATGGIAATSFAAGAIDSAAIAADAIGSSELAASAVAEIADAVWDEVLTAATHNVNDSAGQRIRLINSLMTVSGTVDDVSATASSFVTDLGSTVDDFYKDSLLVFTGNASGLLGQVRPITSYNGTTKAVTFDEPYTSAPTNGDEFSIISIHVHPISQIQAGLATAATLATVLADTNELQIDWADGGRLDIILDARSSQASVNTIDGIVDDILIDTGTTIPATLSSMSGATFDTATDSLEAIRNRGDAAWATATGFSTLDAAGVRSAVGLGSANLDTQLSTIDTVVDGIKVTTDKVDDTLEDDAGTYRFTANALEQAPSGGGGTSDWTADERTAIRSILGIPGSGTTPADPTVGILDTIRDIALDIPTNAELATALASADDATLAAIAALNNISTAQVETAVGVAIADLPTNSELATALGTADDAVLAAISALNDLDATEVQTAAAAAITAASLATAASVADLPTNAELATALGTADDAMLAQIALVKAKTDLIPAAPAAVGDIPTATQNATGVLDLANAIETGLTLRQAIRLATAALAGEVSGAATTEVTIRNAVADSKNRIVATVDADGNRTSIVTDVT